MVLRTEQDRMEKKKETKKKNCVVIGPLAFAIAVHGHIHIIMHIHTNYDFVRRCPTNAREYLILYIYEKESRIISLYVSSMAQSFNIERKITLEK